MEWSMTSSLDSRTSMEDIGVDRWYGKLKYHSMEDDKTIGRIECTKLDLRGSVRPSDWFEVFDCHSDELQALHSEAFDEDEIRYDNITNDVGDASEISQGTKLYIDRIIITDSAFRGLGLGLFMLDEADRKINDRMSLCILCPASVDQDGQADKLDKEWKEAHQKLRKYYGLLGFRSLGKTYVARWNGYLHPPLAKVCPHLFVW